MLIQHFEIDILEAELITNPDAHTNETDAPAEQCFRLLYRSRSLLSDGPGTVDQGLADILRVSRVNNRDKGITGALMFYEYKDWFAQVLEGPEAEVQKVFETITSDPRHKNVEVCETVQSADRIFRRWAMALIGEHGEVDAPLVATSGGLSEAAPWRVTSDQELVLTQMRDLTRAYGRGY